MLQIDPAQIDNQRIGRMGELVVELELIARGWHVGNFNATTNNSAGWDLFATKTGRSVKLRVKSKRPGTDCFRWSARADGSILHSLVPHDDTDYVAAVAFHAVGGYDVYIVPSVVVERTLAENHAAYLAQPKADGTPRRDTTQRNLHMDDREDRPGHGYKRLWDTYRDAWDRLGTPDNSCS